MDESILSNEAVVGVPRYLLPKNISHPLITHLLFCFKNSFHKNSCDTSYTIPLRLALFLNCPKYEPGMSPHFVLRLHPQDTASFCNNGVL